MSAIDAMSTSSLNYCVSCSDSPSPVSDRPPSCALSDTHAIRAGAVGRIIVDRRSGRSRLTEERLLVPEKRNLLARSTPFLFALSFLLSHLATSVKLSSVHPFCESFRRYRSAACPLSCAGTLRARSNSSERLVAQAASLLVDALWPSLQDPRTSSSELS